jgi:C4-dicarboxylate transporter DctM subunit
MRQNETKPATRRNILENFESGFGLLWYALLAAVPVLAWLVRLLGGSDLPYQNELVFHFVVMLTALAGSYTESHNEHLSLSLGIEKRDEKWVGILVAFRNLAGTFILIQFILGSLEMLLVAFAGESVWFIPIQAFIAFIPIGFAGILYHWLRRITRTEKWWTHLIAAILGMIISLPSLINITFTTLQSIPEFVFSLDSLWYTLVPPLIPFLVVLLIAMTPLGLPLYMVLGGAATLLFLRGGVGPGIIMYDGYTVLGNSAIPAIALFTLTGFLLSEGKASERFIEVFLSLFGWMPGGMVLAAILVSAVFTTFTGASGVTILALGGLLYAVLHGSGRYSERFTVGVLTSSGSIGLLFPPSLAIILYGSVAGVNIRHLFLAGLIPGAIMILSRSAFGIGIAMKSQKARKAQTARKAFEFRRFLKALRRALSAIKEAAWELMIPVFTLLLYFTGVATLLETSAIMLIYTLVVEVFIKKDLHGRKLFLVVLKSMRVIGGVLIILMLAKGLSTFIIDAQIPQSLVAFVQDQVSSRIVFLLLLNLALLITGTLMDIYSAIFVVVPLIAPLAPVFGIHPIHMGIIFLANLELGFITPPVGLNLFLSSYRFGKGLPEVYRSILPFLLLQFIVVLIITFVPVFSLALIPR